VQPGQAAQAKTQQILAFKLAVTFNVVTCTWLDVFSSVAAVAENSCGGSTIPFPDLSHLGERLMAAAVDPILQPYWRYHSLLRGPMVVWNRSHFYGDLTEQ
jgi:hypothetical protein